MIRGVETAGLPSPKPILTSEELNRNIDPLSEARPPLRLGFRPFRRVWGTFRDLKVPKIQVGKLRSEQLDVWKLRQVNQPLYKLRVRNGHGVWKTKLTHTSWHSMITSGWIHWGTRTCARGPEKPPLRAIKSRWWPCACRYESILRYATSYRVGEQCNQRWWTSNTWLRTGPWSWTTTS